MGNINLQNKKVKSQLPADKTGYTYNPLLGKNILPAEVVFHPSWWNRRAGIVFDKDFFFNPLKRVESEKKMEQILYNAFGQYGLGSDRKENIPTVGPVHLAAGYMIAGMLGCGIEYRADAPPEVIPANTGKPELGIEDPFVGNVFKDFQNMCNDLKTRYGYLYGDVNWSGVLNTALDICGQSIFIEMTDNPQQVHSFFSEISGVLLRFTKIVKELTGSTSIAVNRTVRHLAQPVFLHSECSVTMISESQYSDFLKPIDREWSRQYRPYGIHFCGKDPHRFAQAFAEIPHLDFLDLGWPGDITLLRQHLPDTFLNIRLSPSELAGWDEDAIIKILHKSVQCSGNPFLTGICCINIDSSVTDEKVNALFKTVSHLREIYRSELKL